MKLLMKQYDVIIIGAGPGGILFSLGTGHEETGIEDCRFWEGQRTWEEKMSD